MGRPNMHRNLVKIDRVVTKMLDNKHTDTLITILRSAVGRINIQAYRNVDRLILTDFQHVK